MVLPVALALALALALGLALGLGMGLVLEWAGLFTSGCGLKKKSPLFECKKQKKIKTGKKQGPQKTEQNQTKHKVQFTRWRGVAIAHDVGVPSEGLGHAARE